MTMTAPEPDNPATTEHRTRRDTARRENRRRSKGFAFVDAVRPLHSTLPLVEVLTDENIHKIHAASMRLLKDTGILIVDYPSTAETFRQFGAKIEESHAGYIVKIDEDTLMHFVRKAPSTFTQLARNPSKNLLFGGRNTIFAPVYGPPFVIDYDRGRRLATVEDFNNFSKLTYMSEHLHHNGGTLVEPNDIDVKERHLDMLLGHILYSDKAFMGSVTHKENARDTVLISELLFGADEIRQNPATLSLINVSSPLRYDDRMLGALEVYAKARQAVLITPFLIAGAMSPVSMAATLAQQGAEALFGICYAQMLNAGTPCVLGSFLSNIDLKSGAPCFGTPEMTLAMLAGAQMTRFYNLPYRSGGNFTASQIPDAQAGYESATSIQVAVQAGVNFVLHAAGWLEGGLIAGYEKFVLDHEVCGMMARYVQGISFDEEEFAWDAYAENGPGGHFLGTAHTMRHYETAFYQHRVFGMDNYEKWEAEGSNDSYKRASKIWKQMLSMYQQPLLDEGKREALHAFVDKRRADIRAGKLRRDEA